MSATVEIRRTRLSGWSWGRGGDFQQPSGLLLHSLKISSKPLRLERSQLNNRGAQQLQPSGKLALIVSVTLWAFSASAQRPACSLQPETFKVEQIDLPELRYRLIDKFGPLYFCNPECPTSCHFVLEQEHAEKAFPQIRRQEEAFRDIVQHLGLGTIREFSAAEKLSVYREYHKLLCGMNLETQGQEHKFKLTSGKRSRVEGAINPKGEITVVDEEPSSFSCPL
jgi:hypothetical protein